MEHKTEGEKVAEEYGSTLSELDSIAKVEINALTMLAEDNKDFAVHIAACIENYLKSVPSKKKLPILYLIDSICKNFPKSIYVQLFTQNIVSNFCKVFEVSPEKTRKSLHKLRMTWGATGTFPTKKLNAIDKRVHEMDPNWPVLHKVAAQTPAKTQQQQTQPQSQQPKQQQSKQQQSKQQQPKQQQPKQQQPKQQPKQQTKQKQQLQLPSQPQSLPVPIPPQLAQPQQGPQQPVSAPILLANQQPIPQIPIYPTQIQQPVLIPAQASQPSNQIPPHQPLEALYQLQPQYQQQVVYPQQSIQPAVATQALPSMDQAPFVQQQTFVQQSSQPFLPQSHNPPLPGDLDITLNTLYGGKQCSNCSLRFDDNSKYGIHLDWHFRQNLKSDNMFARRKWYYPLNLWVQFREISDDEIQENNNPDNNNVNELLISHNDHEVPTAPASKEDEKNICSVCHETFEKFWAEEEEEWRLRNARLYDDERVYHPLCLMDMLQASVQ